MKKFFAVLMAVLLTFTVCGCDFLKDVSDMVQNEVAQAKTFEFDGLSIDLTTDFMRMNFVDEDYDFIVGTGELTIMGEKWLNSDTGLEEFTASEFAEYHRFLLEKANPTELTDLQGIPTLQYETTGDDGAVIKAAVMYYKSTDGFWLVTFAGNSDDFEKAYNDICVYAQSVNIK